jgi:hypothetical protein
VRVVVGQPIQPGGHRVDEHRSVELDRRDPEPVTGARAFQPIAQPRAQCGAGARHHDTQGVRVGRLCAAPDQLGQPGVADVLVGGHQKGGQQPTLQPTTELHGDPVPFDGDRAQDTTEHARTHRAPSHRTVVE